MYRIMYHHREPLWKELGDLLASFVDIYSGDIDYDVYRGSPHDSNDVATLVAHPK